MKSFDGTVIFVSHDRYFVNAIAGRVAEIEDKKLTVYDGGYEGFKRAKAELAERVRRSEETERRAEAEAERQSHFRSKKERAEEALKKAEIRTCEGKIALLEAREAELNDKLADPAVTGDYAKLNAVLEELNGVKEELDALYEKYGQLIN